MAHRLAPEAAAELNEIWFPPTAWWTPFLRCTRASAARGTMCVPGLCGIPAEDYVILYRIEEEDVLILHVLHARRDIADLLRP